MMIIDYALCIMNRPESYSSVGQSATLIMWRSAVQVCLGLLLLLIQDSRFMIQDDDYPLDFELLLEMFLRQKNIS